MKEFKNNLARGILQLKLWRLLLLQRLLIRHSFFCHDSYLRYSTRLFWRISCISERFERLNRRYLALGQKGGD